MLPITETYDKNTHDLKVFPLFLGVSAGSSCGDETPHSVYIIDRKQYHERKHWRFGGYNC